MTVRPFTADVVVDNQISQTVTKQTVVKRAFAISRAGVAGYLTLYASKLPVV